MVTFTHILIYLIGLCFGVLLVCVILLIVENINDGIKSYFRKKEEERIRKNEPFFEDFEFCYVEGSDYEWESDSDD